MAYDKRLADRIREILVDQLQVEEKEMMGGVAFMVNDKMCVGVIKDEMMARIDPDVYDEALEKHGCRPMDFTKKPMKGWVFISPEGIDKVKDLEYWIRLALDFNQKAKPSKKKKIKL
jgi:TfoX/Sxy family transcriptional regulator of competence genes